MVSFSWFPWMVTFHDWISWRVTGITWHPVGSDTGCHLFVNIQGYFGAAIKLLTSLLFSQMT